MPVTHVVLQHKALIIRELFSDGIEDQESDKWVALKRFRASRGCVQNFIQRRGLRSVALHREAGIAPVMQVAENMVEIRSILASYDLDYIYHVDETGLLYNLFPRKT